MFFDIEDNGEVRRDDEGMDCPDVDAAREEAIQTLVGLAKDILPTDGEHRTIGIVVRGPNGQKVFRAQLKYDEGGV